MAAPIDLLRFQAYLTVGFIFMGFTSLLFLKINRTQDTPYMDEIFHVPQAQKYCNGSFTEWDPMITTLPGLYVFSIGILRPVSVYFEMEIEEYCSTYMLRGVNLVFALANLYMMYAIIRKLNPDPKESELKMTMTAITLAIFPVLYFFTFLYYTDAGSTFLVLFMYLLSLHDSHLNAALVSGCAIMFRQTNIIWVVFVAGLTVMKLVEGNKDQEEKTGETESIPKVVVDKVKTVFQFMGQFSNIITLIKTVLPYGLITLAFVVFVYINEGIVVGDRTSHQAGLNFPQLFYFFAFTAVFSFPYFILPYNLVKYATFQKQQAVLVVVSAILAIFVVYFFTYVHPYLLADNRHYPFYVWMKVYQRHSLVKYALIPGYIYAGWSIFNQLSHKSVLWQLVYAVCVVLSLVPQKLLEFRYFIIPYLLFRLNMKTQSYLLLIIEMVFYVVINYVTVELFINKPFHWPDSDVYQRFMW
ncbi:dol-P-Glc:Glc(2)Man(9)GlcNAc(2)-PP-Dol alpha-1,2-glucosyltransferase-like [Glandiceps talaboti]